MSSLTVDPGCGLHRRVGRRHGERSHRRGRAAGPARARRRASATPTTASHVTGQRVRHRRLLPAGRPIVSGRRSAGERASRPRPMKAGPASGVRQVNGFARQAGRAATAGTSSGPTSSRRSSPPSDSASVRARRSPMPWPVSARSSENGSARRSDGPSSPTSISIVRPVRRTVARRPAPRPWTRALSSSTSRMCRDGAGVDLGRRVDARADDVTPGRRRRSASSGRRARRRAARRRTTPASARRGGRARACC